MSYITEQGDTWDAIAKEVYGLEKNADILMQSNPDFLNIFVFPAGIKLETPILTEKDEELPPWRNLNE